MPFSSTILPSSVLSRGCMTDVPFLAGADALTAAVAGPRFPRADASALAGKVSGRAAAPHASSCKSITTPAHGQKNPQSVLLQQQLNHGNGNQAAELLFLHCSSGHPHQPTCENTCQGCSIACPSHPLMSHAKELSLNPWTAKPMPNTTHCISNF